MADEGDCASGDCMALAAATEAVAAGWVLELSCCCLCRHFVEGRAAEFGRWRAVAQAVINGFSKIATHQKKMVYLCQLLIRIAKGKKLECNFEEDPKISPLESALSYWTLLEREESRFDKLHEDIRRLIQIQQSIWKTDILRRLLKLLKGYLRTQNQIRGKLATIIKNKDPYIPLLQSFNYDLLISKVKSYVERFMKENEQNFLLQPWTLEEDKKLKLGVREFGVGNWAKILVHGDFNNRTSVMLKDRWRTLSKIKVSSTVAALKHETDDQEEDAARRFLSLPYSEVVMKAGTEEENRQQDTAESYFNYCNSGENNEGSEWDRCPDKAKREYRVHVRSPGPGESGIPGSRPSPPEQDTSKKILQLFNTWVRIIFGCLPKEQIHVRSLQEGTSSPCSLGRQSTERTVIRKLFLKNCKEIYFKTLGHRFGSPQTSAEPSIYKVPGIP
ncbi:Telomeric repeat-binding factor 1 [Aix galericulata]|nr:Telomeric repeat-binding factor 1 [Aix galericulata]